MVILLLILFLTPFHTYATISSNIQDIQLSKYPISSTKPVSIPTQNNLNPLMILIQNGNVASYSKLKINDTINFSTSWIGEGGYYLNFIPANSGDVTFEVHTYTDNVMNEEVSIKVVELHEPNNKLNKAIQDHAKASHIRYMQYHGSENRSIQAKSLYQSSIDVYINNNMRTLNAIAVSELAFIHAESEQHNKAITLFEAASIEWELLNNNLLELKTDNFKGLSFWNSYQLDIALDVYNSIIDKVTVLNNDSRMFKFFQAQILNNIGLIYWEKKDGINSKNHFIQSLSQYGIVIDAEINIDQVINGIQALPNYNDIAITLNNLALIENSLGYPNRAETLWRIVLEVSQSNLDTLLNARVKNNLATTLTEKGAYDEARLLLDQAIHSFTKLSNMKWLYLAQYQSSQLNLQLGMINLAEIQFKKNLQLRNSENTPKDIVELNLKLVEIYRIQKKYNQSIQLGIDTLKLAKKIGHHKSIAIIHQNNFIINKTLNNLDLARNEINLALASIKNKTLTKIESELNIHKAELDLLQNNTNQAINILEIEALKLKNIWDTNLLNKANNLLTQAYLKNNNHVKAFEIILDEINNIQFYINSSKNQKVQLELSNMLKGSLNIFSLVTLHLAQTELGFTKTNQMLMRFNNNNRTVKYDIIKGSNKVDLFSLIEAKSIALENNSLSDIDRKQIQNDMIELKAKIDFSYTAQKQLEVPNINFKIVQEKIDDKTLVVQFSIGKAGGISWWISKNKVETHEVGNKKELTQLINLAHDEFIQKTRGDENIQLLSKKLLHPLKSFKNIDKIKLILDEPLNLIPFTALMDPRTEKSQVLAVNTKIHRLASIQSLNSQNKTSLYNPKEYLSLLIADPVTSANDKRLSIAVTEDYSNSFGRLVGSKSEAENISGFLNAKTIQGFSANKQNLMNSKFRDKNILHFATHAFFHPEISGLSSLVLSTYNENGQNNPSAYLRALDISTLKFNADLVVLSGCETGVNKYDNSLGLGGLTESFMQAGSKNLIASLWKVNDRITKKMMTEFYKGYTSGLSIEDALWQAQKRIRETRRTKHPKYWAGWFLISQ